MARGIPLLLVLLLQLASCKKQVGDNEHPEFIGEWTCTDAINSVSYRLNIPATGKGEFFNDGHETDGKVKIGNDKLSIGTKTFRVASYPAVDPSLDTNSTSYPSNYERPFVT